MFYLKSLNKRWNTDEILEKKQDIFVALLVFFYFWFLVLYLDLCDFDYSGEYAMFAKTTELLPEAVTFW